MSEMSEKSLMSEFWAEQRVIINFCVEVGKTPVETKKFLESSACRPSVSRALVYKWHKRFDDGRVSTKDNERVGRPAIADEKALTLVRKVIDTDWLLTVRDIAEICDLKRTTVHDILTEHFGMQRVSARWVPRLLTDENKERRVSTSRAFLRKWKTGGDAFLDRIITSDETWLHYYDPETKQQSSVWKSSDSPPPKKSKRARSIGKEMYIMFMDRRGMLLTHPVPKRQTVNSEDFSKVKFS